MRNPLYSGDPADWDTLDIQTQLRLIVKDICTGPCGQSSSIITRRDRIRETLETVAAWVDEEAR